MSTELTTLLGNEIKVFVHPRVLARQFTSIAGVHGITSMTMGTRGFLVDITGQYRVWGASYAAAYTEALTAMDNIEALMYRDMDTYTHNGGYFHNSIFHNFKMVPMPGGKQFAYTTEGYMIGRFTIQLVAHL